MKVIVISGKAQNGKDTMAGLIKKALESEGSKVPIAHYADLLKYICKQFFNWNGDKDERGRHILQHVGTDIIRKQCPDYWVEFLIDIVNFFPNEWEYMLIPDCRFPNEIERLIESGLDTVHVRVTRDGFESPLSHAQQLHESETALDNIHPDYYIRNNGTLQDLEMSVIDFLSELNGYHQITVEEYCVGKYGHQPVLQYGA